jgi:hypothetical protein
MQEHLVPISQKTRPMDLIIVDMQLKSSFSNVASNLDGVENGLAIRRLFRRRQRVNGHLQQPGHHGHVSTELLVLVRTQGRGQQHDAERQCAHAPARAQRAGAALERREGGVPERARVDQHAHAVQLQPLARADYPVLRGGLVQYDSQKGRLLCNARLIFVCQTGFYIAAEKKADVRFMATKYPLAVFRRHRYEKHRVRSL